MWVIIMCFSILCHCQSFPSSPTEREVFEDFETEHDHRMQRLATQDVVNTVVLADYLFSQVCF